MGLIINQGKQDLSGDKNFEVMVSPSEIAQITKIEMDKDWDNTLNITYKVISEGKFKGRLFWDRVSFDPKSQFSWKYRNLRKAAGCPYTEGENPKVDIEALLLNKAITVELLVRKGNDGNDYQSVKYKASTAKVKVEAPSTIAVATEDTTSLEESPFAVSSTDEEIPW